MRSWIKNLWWNLHREVNFFTAVLIMLVASISTVFLVWGFYSTIDFSVPEIVAMPRIKKPMPFAKIERPIPPPVSMARVKTQGCVADGLLSEYTPDSDKYIEMINRSNCYYLHRAIETWNQPPDFDTINYVMNRITKKDVVYGMFIAEALRTNAEYYNEYEKRYFDFDAMCRQGSKDVWGEHTCKPNFANEEYRNYIEYITQKAMDLGVQSFMFGQIYLQEGGEKDYASKIVKDMRSYAKKKGLNIIIGAQTGSIADPEYLQLFDYIEGGVGIDGNGDVESGPCLSRKGSCWALLWHKNFSGKAKNVLLHLDWTGIYWDDLDIFARMTKEKRADTLQKLYTFFTGQDMGFLMPLSGALDKTNGGCYGPKKRFYSASQDYSCQDEEAINKILGGK